MPQNASLSRPVSHISLAILLAFACGVPLQVALSKKANLQCNLLVVKFRWEVTQDVALLVEDDRFVGVNYIRA
jgi:hypothetical protein